MNGDQARAVLPVLRKHDHTWPSATLGQLMSALQTTFQKFADDVARAAKQMMPITMKVARYDARVADMRRQQMIYGRLDGRRPKR